MVNITFYKRKKKHFTTRLEEENKKLAKYRIDIIVNKLEEAIKDCNKRIAELQKENYNKRQEHPRKNIRQRKGGKKGRRRMFAKKRKG